MDGLYVHIFSIYMPLIYGEGINAQQLLEMYSDQYFFFCRHQEALQAVSSSYGLPHYPVESIGSALVEADVTENCLSVKILPIYLTLHLYGFEGYREFLMMHWRADLDPE